MKTPKQALKFTVSFVKGYRLAIADFNALDQWLDMIRKEGFDPTLITHAEAPGLPELEKWSSVNKVPIKTLQPAREKEGFLLTIGRAMGGKKTSLDRNVACLVDQCLQIGVGGSLAEECSAADLPVWKFTTFAK